MSIIVLFGDGVDLMSMSKEDQREDTARKQILIFAYFKKVYGEFKSEHIKALKSPPRHWTNKLKNGLNYSYWKLDIEGLPIDNVFITIISDRSKFFDLDFSAEDGEVVKELIISDFSFVEPWVIKSTFPDWKVFYKTPHHYSVSSGGRSGEALKKFSARFKNILH